MCLRKAAWQSGLFMALDNSITYIKVGIIPLSKGFTRLFAD